LPAVIAIADAVAPGAPSVRDECRDEQAFVHTLGDRAAVERAFAKAHHLVSHRMVISRLTTNSMESRGCLAGYDPREDRITLRCTVQVPHMICRIIAEEIFRVSRNQIPHHCGQCGRGFGTKGALYPECSLAALAAKLLGRPVKWMAERSEAKRSWPTSIAATM
jgi:aerobic carbon-monoxide dehydrogenase large subunit